MSGNQKFCTDCQVPRSGKFCLECGGKLTEFVAFQSQKQEKITQEPISVIEKLVDEKYQHSTNDVTNVVTEIQEPAGRVCTWLVNFNTKPDKLCLY